MDLGHSHAKLKPPSWEHVPDPCACSVHLLTSDPISPHKHNSTVNYILYLVALNFIVQSDYCLKILGLTLFVLDIAKMVIYHI